MKLVLKMTLKKGSSAINQQAIKEMMKRAEKISMWARQINSNDSIESDHKPTIIAALESGVINTKGNHISFICE